MAFSDYVSLVFGKRPVWLYKITVNGISYHYTSKGGGYETPEDRPNDSFPSGQTWAHAAIVRGEIFQTSLSNRNDTWLRLPTKNALVTALISEDDSTKSEVEIWKGFIGDPDNEFVLYFKGRIVDVEPTLILTTLVCETSASETQRSSVAQVVQRSCRHTHYFTNSDGGGCRLNLADHQVAANVTVMVGRTLTIADAANEEDGHFTAGVLEYEGVEYMIETHVGDSVIIEKAPQSLLDAVANSPAEVLIAPGCSLTINRCSFFQNTDNFGGFEEMEDTPFDGRSIA